MARTVSPVKFAREYHRHVAASENARTATTERILKLQLDVEERIDALERSLRATVQLNDQFAEINAAAWRSATGAELDTPIPNPPKETRNRKPKVEDGVQLPLDVDEDESGDDYEVE